MQCLVLDVDALSHGSGLGLLPTIEVFISSLPDTAYVERSVYTECVRSGVAKHLDGWQRKGLLHEPVDYRKLDDGDARLRAHLRKWRGLSREDCASLVVAQSRQPAGLLTCENLLGTAAGQLGIVALDLFDVTRYGIKLGHITIAAAASMCAVWEQDAFSAGRPGGYKATYYAEYEFREQTRPLP